MASNSEPLTKDELRRRRLLALSGPAASISSGPPPLGPLPSDVPDPASADQQQQQRQSPPPANLASKKPRQTSPAASPHLDPSRLAGGGPEVVDEDEELMKALAMSMEGGYGGGGGGGGAEADAEPEWLRGANKAAQMDWSSAGESGGLGGVVGAASDDDDIAKAIALSLEESKRGSAPTPTGGQGYESGFAAAPQRVAGVESLEARRARLSGPYGSSDGAAFEGVMWGGGVTQADKDRWMSQGVTCRAERLSAFLAQEHGGPCGVLAALGAEMVRWFLFGGEGGAREAFVEDLRRASPTGEEKSDEKEGGDSLSQRYVDKALAIAIGSVLSRAGMQGCPTAEGGVRVVTSHGIDGAEEGDCRGFWAAGGSGEEVEAKLAEDVAEYLLQGGRLTAFKEPGGVLLVVRSLVATRGAEQIADDMDDPHPHCAFTAQFGHCSQELMNLLMTGAATSNVFDGVKDMGGLLMKGCLGRPHVGYLTQIEALRYCSVGTYLKTPKKPIWIVGSSSHFTVLFALDMAPITESNSDQILEKCRRAFKVVDGDENGFIQMTSLRDVLLLLDLMDKVGEAGLPRLANSLEESGCGIILWDAFWKACSRLLTGAGLESVLEKDDSSVIAVDSDGMALTTNQGQGAAGSNGDGADEKKLNFEADEMGDQFILYHYNGLREGTVTPFGVQRLSAEDAVGASVAMNTGGGGGGGGGDRGLEEVARTRWPSAKFEWFGKNPPSID